MVSGAPIYLRSLEKVGIQNGIDKLGPLNRNVIVSSNWIALDQADFEQNDQFVRDATHKYFGDVIDSESLRIKSEGHFWDFPGLEPNRSRVASRAYFQYMEGLSDHVVYVDGRPPTDEVKTLPDGTRQLEVAIYLFPRPGNIRPKDTRLLVMKVGDVIDEVSESRGVGKVRAVITGIFVERDDQDPFWNGIAQSILNPPPPEDIPERDPAIVLFTAGDSITTP